MRTTSSRNSPPKFFGCFFISRNKPVLYMKLWKIHLFLHSRYSFGHEWMTSEARHCLNKYQKKPLALSFEQVLGHYPITNHCPIPQKRQKKAVVWGAITLYSGRYMYLEIYWSGIDLLYYNAAVFSWFVLIISRFLPLIICSLKWSNQY